MNTSLWYTFICQWIFWVFPYFSLWWIVQLLSVNFLAMHRQSKDFLLQLGWIWQYKILASLWTLIWQILLSTYSVVDILLGGQSWMKRAFRLTDKVQACLEIRGQRQRVGHTDLAASSGTIWKAVCRGALMAWPWDPRETNPDILCSVLRFAIIY